MPWCGSVVRGQWSVVLNCRMWRRNWRDSSKRECHGAMRGVKVSQAWSRWVKPKNICVTVHGGVGHHGLGAFRTCPQNTQNTQKGVGCHGLGAFQTGSPSGRALCREMPLWVVEGNRLRVECAGKEPDDPASGTDLRNPARRSFACIRVHWRFKGIWCAVPDCAAKCRFGWLRVGVKAGRFFGTRWNASLPWKVVEGNGLRVGW
jgi:hypothetical protein